MVLLRPTQSQWDGFQHLRGHADHEGGTVFNVKGREINLHKLFPERKLKPRPPTWQTNAFTRYLLRHFCVPFSVIVRVYTDDLWERSEVTLSWLCCVRQWIHFFLKMFQFVCVCVCVCTYQCPIPALEERRVAVHGSWMRQSSAWRNMTLHIEFDAPKTSGIHTVYLQSRQHDSNAVVIFSWMIE